MIVSKPVTQDEFESLKRRVKKLEEFSQVAQFITDFNWKEFGAREQQILTLLYRKAEGFTTTELAREMKLENPERSGRVIVRRKLRKIEQYSKRIKGAPIVARVGRHWTLNFDEFSFQIDEKKEGLFAEEEGLRDKNEGLTNE